MGQPIDPEQDRIEFEQFVAANGPKIGRHFLMANLAAAESHLATAHQHAPANTDTLTIEHIRAAWALVLATLEGLKAR